MRSPYQALSVVLLSASGVLAGCQTAVVSVPAPVRDAQAGSPPVLESVTMRYNVRGANGAIVSVVPDFHFKAPNGNAVLIRREIVEASVDSSVLHVQPNKPINIPAAVQKQGAVVSGGWTCGTAQYHVTLRASILDADGNLSNALQYTIHCNGG